ncbi:DUF3618 domain-containing protein [Arthrobacter sp. M4]|uniref:DUF3618 domain-containing protein n=1 Tax=Arthrobacter sp. M4 TaxID=218160 RepID=UPI001CDCE890|nr:DUF3618 domain-containing protein [Arthrobacter sp. M4]MCA4135195.1 DUF3618 domain-containing protein [Arthrobacter sp. M4]
MTQNPEALRADIEATRRRLSTDVDAVADKITPSHIVQRKMDRVRDAVFGARDDVEHSARTAAHRAQGAMSDVGDVPQVVARKTQGSPIAAGLIAFGAGLLVSALFPPSEKEREAAQAVKEAAEPVTSSVSEAAHEVADHLREPAKEAAQNVRDSATESAQHVKAEGESAASEVRERAEVARDRVQDQ